MAGNGIRDLFNNNKKEKVVKKKLNIKKQEAQMKQYIIINSDLKMSKGKIARVCHSAGVFSSKVSNFWQYIKWYNNNRTTIVLKATSEQYNELLNQLRKNKVKHKEHVDAGHTQVEKGNCCMLTFFENKRIKTDNLKLY